MIFLSYFILQKSFELFVEIFHTFFVLIKYQVGYFKDPYCSYFVGFTGPEAFFLVSPQKKTPARAIFSLSPTLAILISRARNSNPWLVLKLLDLSNNLDRLHNQKFSGEFLKFNLNRLFQLKNFLENDQRRLKENLWLIGNVTFFPFCFEIQPWPAVLFDFQNKDTKDSNEMKNLFERQIWPLKRNI